MTSPFETNHQPAIGEVEQLAEGLQVITANNAGAMTFTGTRSYILGEDEVKGMRILNTKTEKVSEISISGFFVAIGHQPNTEIFKEFITMDTAGYIKTIPGTTKTNVEGVFACGDAQDNVYRQAVTAAGTGCMAALDAERFLAALESH